MSSLLGLSMNKASKDYVHICVFAHAHRIYLFTAVSWWWRDGSVDKVAVMASLRAWSLSTDLQARCTARTYNLSTQQEAPWAYIHTCTCKHTHRHIHTCMFTAISSHFFWTQHSTHTHCHSSHCFLIQPRSSRTILVLLLHKIFVIALTDNKKPGSHYFYLCLFVHFSLNIWLPATLAQWWTWWLASEPLPTKAKLHPLQRGSRGGEPLEMLSSKLWCSPPSTKAKTRPY